MDLIDVYRVFHVNILQYTFFSAAHGTFSKIDHALVHQASLNKFKNIEITPFIIANQNKTRSPKQNKLRKVFKTWALNSIKFLLKEIRKERKRFLDGNKNTTYGNLWDVAKATLRGKFIAVSA
jgi:hypothetical protein